MIKMIIKCTLKLIVVIITINLCRCKHHPRQRRFAKNLDNIYIYQPRQVLPGADDINRFFPWRHRMTDVYTNADAVNIDEEPYRSTFRERRRTHNDRKVDKSDVYANGDTAHIDKDPYRPTFREQRRTHNDKKVNTRTDKRGPDSIHKRVDAIRRKVQHENDEKSIRRSKRNHRDINSRLDSMFFRHRLKRSSDLLRNEEFNSKNAIDERMTQEVNRMLANIKEEAINEINMDREPKKKREENDKAEKRLNHLLRLKSLGISKK